MQNRIKEIRIKKGYSLDYVSRTTNIPKSSLSEYEKGPRQPRKKEIWEELAKLFGVSVPYLMGLSEASTEIDEDGITKFLEEASIKKENETLAADFNFPKTTDVAGNEIQHYDKDKFNLVLSDIEYLGHRPITIKNTENLHIRYILKFTDPTNKLIKFTSIRALILVEYFELELSAKNEKITFPIYLYLSSKDETLNDVIDYSTIVNTIDGLEAPLITQNLVNSYLRFLQMLDDENVEKQKKLDFLNDFCEYNKSILGNIFKSIEFTNKDIEFIFKINLFNQEFITITQ